MKPWTGYVFRKLVRLAHTMRRQGWICWVACRSWELRSVGAGAEVNRPIETVLVMALVYHHKPESRSLRIKRLTPWRVRYIVSSGMVSFVIQEFQCCGEPATYRAERGARRAVAVVPRPKESLASRLQQTTWPGA